jgi:phage shock protein PspC (stress-responsive transcriptional regulator)
MPAGTGDVTVILTLPILAVGGITAGIASYFGAPDWSIWVAGIIGSSISLAFIAKWILYNDG